MTKFIDWLRSLINSNQNAKKYTLENLETAAALWEAVLLMEQVNVTTLRIMIGRPGTYSPSASIQLARSAIGTAALRMRVVSWTDQVEKDWNKVAETYGLSFDLDFIPNWIIDNIDWSDSHHPRIKR